MACGQFHDGNDVRDEDAFKAGAVKHSGDSCLTQRVKHGGTERDIPIKQWLADLQKTNPARSLQDAHSPARHAQQPGAFSQLDSKFVLTLYVQWLHSTVASPRLTPLHP